MIYCVNLSIKFDRNIPVMKKQKKPFILCPMEVRYKDMILTFKFNEAEIRRGYEPDTMDVKALSLDIKPLMPVDPEEITEILSMRLDMANLPKDMEVRRVSDLDFVTDDGRHVIINGPKREAVEAR